MALEFSAVHLIVGEESPSKEHLKIIFSVLEDNFEHDGTSYIFNFDGQDNFFWFYARFGRSLPYSTTVINTHNKQEEANPRTTTQAETNSQLFGLYSLSAKTLYLSNTQKMTAIESYFKSKLAVDVYIKKFYKNIDEFIAQLKKVDSVEFVAKSDLFGVDGSVFRIFDNPKDMFGLGMPRSITLKAEYAGASVTEKFNNFLKQV